MYELTLILRIPSLIYDLTLLSLVIYKTVKFWMDGGIDSVPGLVVTLVRDQCLYFLVYASLPQYSTYFYCANSLYPSVLACGVVNISVYWVVGTEFISVASVFVIPVVCIVGSRVLLNLREAADQNVIYNGEMLKVNNDAESAGQVFSEMRFA